MINKNIPIICPSNKILNNKTNRCVLKTGKIGKKILSSINNPDCKNIQLIWHSNSCYIDSLLVALFFNKNKYIEDFLLNAKIINHHNSKLSKIAKLIQSELKYLYLIISNQKIIDYKKTTEKLRKYLQEYYLIFLDFDPNTQLLYDIDDEWTHSQLDYIDLLYFFQNIFNINDKSLKFMDGSNIQFSNIINDIPSDFITSGKKSLLISDIYPNYSIKYKLSNDNKYKDNYGNLHSYYIKKFQLLKGNLLFIIIHRNLGFEKNNIKIIPSDTIKLPENNFDLHLNSIIIHYGNKDTGHYITLFKCNINNNWYEYDDLNIKQNLVYIGDLKKIIKNKNYTSNIVALIYSKL